LIEIFSFGRAMYFKVAIEKIAVYPIAKAELE